MSINVGGTQTLSIMQGFSTNPCSVCQGSNDISCFGCTTFSAISAGFNFGKSNEPQSYYRALLFSMIAIQGFFSGLVAGQIGSESVASGIKHSLIMAFSGVVIFILMIKIGFI